MVSGDSVVQVLAQMSPGTEAATFDSVAGGSTIDEQVLVCDFPATGTAHMDWLCKLEGYGGGGLTFTRPFTMSSATSGKVRIDLALRRMATAENVGSAHTYQYNGTSIAVPSAAGRPKYPSVAFTDGADMDNVVEGELFILRERRDSGHVDDNASGDMEAWGPPLGLET